MTHHFINKQFLLNTRKQQMCQASHLIASPITFLVQRTNTTSHAIMPQLKHNDIPHGNGNDKGTVTWPHRKKTRKLAKQYSSCTEKIINIYMGVLCLPHFWCRTYSAISVRVQSMRVGFSEHKGVREDKEFLAGQLPFETRGTITYLWSKCLDFFSVCIFICSFFFLGRQ